MIENVHLETSKKVFDQQNESNSTNGKYKILGSTDRDSSRIRDAVKHINDFCEPGFPEECPNDIWCRDVPNM